MFGLMIVYNGSYRLGCRLKIPDPVKILPIAAHISIFGCFIVIDIV